MPGPVSHSYEGPSDDKPALPEWAFQTAATMATTVRDSSSGEGIDENALRREKLSRRLCQVMGWEYQTCPVWTGLRKVALAEAVVPEVDLIADPAVDTDRRNHAVDCEVLFEVDALAREDILAIAH